MKKTKSRNLIICIVAGILGLLGLTMAVMKITGAGPFAPSDKKYQHLSANGIETWDSGYMRTELTSLELVTLMGNGINLGNTMEAYGRAVYGTTASVSSYETYWGQPVTTQEIITAMKHAGFDSLRIPVAWTNAMNYESGDYTIREDYLNRVEEIINYALNEDMYVIINDHWDGSWWGMFGSANEETRKQAMELYISMWTQIAERYKEYSDYLIFESANEELGSRLNDVDVAADSGTLSEQECFEMTNTINQTFVNTIRSTGGNNAQRFLLIAGYNTDIQKTCDNRFVMPTDTAENKLMISVHYYTPGGYCGNSSLSVWSKFTEQGYGVVIGEYAVALRDDGTVKDNICDFLSNFLYNCDLYGYCPMLWDCSSLFVRTKLSFIDDDVANLYLERRYSAQASLTEEEIKTAAQTAIETAEANAVSKFEETEFDAEDTGTAIAWIMFNSSDWSIMYSVGDSYDPASKTDGLIATDVEVTGEGTYTVSLDFTKTGAGFANGTAFCALAIGNGEILYPGYLITITELAINGEPYTLIADPYTTTDDQKCTRVNIFNEWVTAVPAEARTADGDISNVAPTIVNNADLSHMETLSITFTYGPAQ